MKVTSSVDISYSVVCLYHLLGHSLQGLHRLVEYEFFIPIAIGQYFVQETLLVKLKAGKDG